MVALKDLTGQRFGKLVVKYRTAHSRNGWVRWHCVCDCGQERDILSGHLVKGNTVSCGCKWKITGPEHHNWSGYNNISGHHFKLLEHAASGKTRAAIEFSITKEYLSDLFDEQEGKCALTGVPLQILCVDRFRTASLDRINNTVGYVEGNVQWVHKHINMMKGKLDQEYFINLCKKVTEFVQTAEANNSKFITIEASNDE